jgi:hypothetical protein
MKGTPQLVPKLSLKPSLAFTDDDIVFETDVLPHLHYTFAYSIHLYKDDMPGELSAEECKKRFADNRTHRLEWQNIAIFFLEIRTARLTSSK